MCLQGAVAALGLDAPDSDCLVVRGREQVLSARVEHQAPYPVIVAYQRHQTLARAHVPDLNTAAGQGVRQTLTRLDLDVTQWPRFTPQT